MKTEFEEKYPNLCSSLRKKLGKPDCRFDEKNEIVFFLYDKNNYFKFKKDLVGLELENGIILNENLWETELTLKNKLLKSMSEKLNTRHKKFNDFLKE